MAKTKWAKTRGGKPTAWGIFLLRSGEGKDYNWSAFCTAVDYCTSPCQECAMEEVRHRAARLKQDGEYRE